MPNIPILCMICSTNVKESEFFNHLQQVHGTESQLEARAKEQNISKQTPIVLDKEAPPSQEFMEVAAMLDAKPVQQSPTPPAVQKGATTPANTPQQEEPKPIVLKYKYEGNCTTCNTPIRTIVVRANGQTVAVALCLDHGEIKQREVPDLEEIVIDTSKALMSTPEYDDHWEHVRLYNEAIQKKAEIEEVKDKLLEHKPEVQIRPKKRKRGVKHVG